jgi:predicted amidophosphoribosyltransferase
MAKDCHDCGAEVTTAGNRLCKACAKRVRHAIRVQHSKKYGPLPKLRRRQEMKDRTHLPFVSDPQLPWYEDE